ncbi:MAG: hypothetical protein ACOYJJ_01980 [Anaerovoracaceae bacterium]|jgi:hypothetical protein
MIITAKDACTRAALARLLVKIDQNPEYSRKLGVEDASILRTATVKEEKEGRENVEPVNDHTVCGHSF